MYATADHTLKTTEALVFMNLGGTGLPLSQPCITLTALIRSCLKNTAWQHSRPVPLFPHVIDKLCLCINPGKEFTPATSTVTGLNNEVLSNKNQALKGHVLYMVIAFLSWQQPSSCLAAHDHVLPLLKVELSIIGFSLLSEAFCADSAEATEELDKESNQHLSHQFTRYSGALGKREDSLADMYLRSTATTPFEQWQRRRRCHCLDKHLPVLIKEPDALD
nr:PREDICTED: LOW QUALITY PROTEIN: three-prime repair exonuclease 1 [Apteryx mantelli mantelli]